MNLGFWEILLILLAILILFGAGKLPNVMSQIGKGIKGLRKELKDDSASESDKTKNK
jgi:sec-independent protein translocase protein TatA